MKKLSILLLATTLTVMVSCKKDDAAKKIKSENVEVAKSRDVQIKKGAALATFDKTVHEFGTINEGEIVETTFKVTNSGKTDLIITDAQVTCGCTVPVWPKAPIKPGETKDIKVKFNSAGKANRQSKRITLMTNTKAGREFLTLKGMVTPKAK